MRTSWCSCCKDRPAKVNLIPFNPFPGTRYRRSSAAAIERFRDILNTNGVIATTRRTRGDDIDAACGQLVGRVTTARRCVSAPSSSQWRCNREACSDRSWSTLVCVLPSWRHARADEHVTKPQPERAAEINLELGIDYLRKGNLQQAKDKIDRALEQNPRNAQAQSVAGMLYDRLGDREQGRCRTSQRAVSLEPENPDFKNNYAVLPVPEEAATSAARSWRSRRRRTRCTRRPRSPT